MNTPRPSPEGDSLPPLVRLEPSVILGLVVAVDFDGTCVTHEYPKVGRHIGAPRVLHRIVKEGGSLILWTMRSGTPN